VQVALAVVVVVEQEPDGAVAAPGALAQQRVVPVVGMPGVPVVLVPCAATEAAAGVPAGQELDAVADKKVIVVLRQSAQAASNRDRNRCSRQRGLRCCLHNMGSAYVFALPFLLCDTKV